MKTLIYIISFLFCYSITMADGNYWDDSKVGREYMIYTCVILPPVEIEIVGPSEAVTIIKGTQLYPNDLAVGFVVTGLPYGSDYGYQFHYDTGLPYGDGSGLTVNGIWELYDHSVLPTPTWVPFASDYQHKEFSNGGAPPAATGIDIQFRVTNVDAETNPLAIALGLHDIPITLTVTYVQM